MLTSGLVLMIWGETCFPGSYGSRIALWVAFLGAMIQLLIGVAVGLACGFFGRWVDRGLSFLTDLTWCIPGTILALAVVTMIGKGLTNTIIAISLVAWASYARTVRAKTPSAQYGLRRNRQSLWRDQYCADGKIYTAQHHTILDCHGIFESAGNDYVYNHPVLPRIGVAAAVTRLGAGDIHRH